MRYFFATVAAALVLTGHFANAGELAKGDSEIGCFKDNSADTALTKLNQVVMAKPKGYIPLLGTKFVDAINRPFVASSPTVFKDGSEYMACATFTAQ
jgi:hypothetical protein